MTSCEAPVAVALLRTLRVAREALRRRRPIGQRDLLRIYRRHRADLEPFRLVGDDDPGHVFLRTVLPKLAKIPPGRRVGWRELRPGPEFDRAAFRRTACGNGDGSNNTDGCLTRPSVIPPRKPDGP